MDWPESTEPVLTVFPRGMKRTGGRLGSAEVVKDNPLTWTTKHGSLVTTINGVGTADGFNERGLAAHMLYLTATAFGPRDPSNLGVHAGLWAQYLLDNAATVNKALAVLDNVQYSYARNLLIELLASCMFRQDGGDCGGGKQVCRLSLQINSKIQIARISM